MLIVRIIENNTMYSVQELHLCLFLFLAESFSTSLVSSIFSVHSSTRLSTNFFLHLQLSQSKYSPISHDLSQSHLQLLGFQINPLSHTPYQSILCIHICICLHSNVVYCYKHLHLVYIYIYMFNAILNASFHQFLTLD